MKRQFNVRINADIEEKLDRLAAHYGITRAQVVRNLIKRADARATGPMTIAGDAGGDDMLEVVERAAERDPTDDST